MEVFKKTLLPKIWENNAILDWSNTVDYSIGSIVKLNGGGALYRALAPSGPNQSSGPQSPETDDGTYWINESDIVHRFGDEEVDGLKMFKTVVGTNKNFFTRDLRFVYPDTASTSNLNTYISFQDMNDLVLSALHSRVRRNEETDEYPWNSLRFTIRPASDTTTVISGLQGFALYWDSVAGYHVSPTKSGIKLGIGTSGNTNKWSEIWCQQSSINSSSDERMKQSITSIPDEILDTWDGINWIQYRFNDAVEEKGLEKARLHSGLIAQEVDRVFKSNNLDISKYGLFLHDEWKARPEVLDEEGNIEEEAVEAGDAYGIRYTEALCMEAAYQRRENRRLKDRVSELENKVLQLEDKLNQLLNK